MTEKRFTTDNGSHEDVCLVDNLTGIEYESNFMDIVNLMNDNWNQTKRFEKHNQDLSEENENLKSAFHREKNTAIKLGMECDKLNIRNNELEKENEELKEELNKLKKFEYGGEHIKLSINIETGELQRHIYATGQWFGDFDRVLVDNWLSKEDYQRFINRVIEVYNTEFKKELSE